MNNKIAALAAGAVLAAALAGCSGASNTVNPPTQPPAAAAAPASTPAQGVAAFGGSVTFPNGVKVTASQPTVVTATDTAAGAVGGKIVTLNLSVTNGSKKPFDAGGAMIGYPKFSYGADGTDAQTAIDDSIGTGHLSTVLPGETQTVKLGFGVPAAGFSAVRLEVNGPTFDDQPAVFKGAVK